jgi:hypothetical protein
MRHLFININEYIYIYIYIRRSKRWPLASPSPSSPPFRSRFCRHVPPKSRPAGPGGRWGADCGRLDLLYGPFCAFELAGGRFRLQVVAASPLCGRAPWLAQGPCVSVVFFVFHDGFIESRSVSGSAFLQRFVKTLAAAAIFVGVGSRCLLSSA